MPAHTAVLWQEMLNELVGLIGRDLLVNLSLHREPICSFTACLEACESRGQHSRDNCMLVFAGGANVILRYDRFGGYRWHGGDVGESLGIGQQELRIELTPTET